MLGMAAGFLILIACLGLLGMATFSMESRVNEVGIRKVLGAGVFGLTMLLSKETIRLVLMGLAIASPLAWLLNNLLLQDFSARISIDPFIFIGSALFIMSLALLLIGSQTVRTALTNPVQTLRHE
jgi:putative ABC transport system permease protein